MGDDNVYVMIMRQLTAYYIGREFGALPLDEYDLALEAARRQSPQIVWRKSNK
jgi:hypothetical protein